MTSAGAYQLSSLEGKVAIVTGGTQGLGEATAHLFADRGARGLVICGRNEKNGEKVKAALDKKGAKTVFVKADLGTVEDSRAVVAAADKAFGRADILVNVAGITDRGTIWDTSPELFDQMAEEAAAQWTSTFNPRPVDRRALRELYQCAYSD